MIYNLHYKNFDDSFKLLPDTNIIKTEKGLVGEIITNTDAGIICIKRDNGNYLTYIKNHKTGIYHFIGSNFYYGNKLLCVGIAGGLGNQMFQYAFAKYIQSHYKDYDIKYDLLWFYGKKRPRKLLLEHYNIKSVPVASIKESIICDKSSVYENNLKGTLPDGYNKRFLGYWQNWDYVKPNIDELRKDFTLNIDKLKQENSNLYNTYSALNDSLFSLRNTYYTCAIHVRRTDYTSANNQKVYNNLGIDYYKAAVGMIRGTACTNKTFKFIVFSDDIKWCKEQFSKCSFINKDELEFFSINDIVTGGIYEMDLMKKCHSNIIANSSFSWWSAMLNNNPSKIIVAPKKWYVSNEPKFNQFHKFGCDGIVIRI